MIRAFANSKPKKASKVLTKTVPAEAMLATYKARVKAEGATLVGEDHLLDYITNNIDTINQASLVLTPSAYKAGKLLALKPVDGLGDFSFARNSLGSFINNKQFIIQSVVDEPRISFRANQPELIIEPQSTNLITHPISIAHQSYSRVGVKIKGDESTLGPELIVNGSFSDNTWWNLTGNWTIANGKASRATGTQSYIYKENIITIGKSYLLKVIISNYTSGNLQSYGNFIGSINSNGVFEYLFTCTYPGVGFGSSDFIGSIDEYSLKEIKGFPSPHNIYKNHAYKIVNSNTLGYHYLYQDVFGLENNKKYTLTVKAQRNECKYFHLQNGHYGAGAWFDLEQGKVVSTQMASAKIFKLADNYYECSLSCTTDRSSFYTIFAFSNTMNLEFQGDGISGGTIFDVQFEKDSGTSSVFQGIENAQTTRLTEFVYKQNLQLTNFFGKYSGSMFIHVGEVSGTGGLSLLKTTDWTDMLSIYNNSLNNIELVYIVNSIVIISFSSQIKFSMAKICLTWEYDIIKLFVNGALCYTSSSLTLHEFSRAELNGIFHGLLVRLKSYKLFNSSLTDAKAISLTQ